MDKQKIWERGYNKGYNAALNKMYNEAIIWINRYKMEELFYMRDSQTEVARAVAQTVANPSIPLLAEDLILIHKLAAELKDHLKGKNPTLRLIFDTLFNLT